MEWILSSPDAAEGETMANQSVRDESVSHRDDIRSMSERELSFARENPSPSSLDDRMHERASELRVPTMTRDRASSSSSSSTSSSMRVRVAEDLIARAELRWREAEAHVQHLQHQLDLKLSSDPSSSTISSTEELRELLKQEQSQSAMLKEHVRHQIELTAQLQAVSDANAHDKHEVMKKRDELEISLSTECNSHQELQSKFMALAQHAAHLQKSESVLQTELHHLRESVTLKDSMATDLREQVKKLNDKLSNSMDVKKHIKNLQKEIDEKTKFTDEIQSKLCTMAREVCAKDSRFAHLQAHVATREKQILIMEQRCSTQSEQLAEVEAALHTQRKRDEHLAQSNKELKSRVDTLSNQVASAELVLTSVQSKGQQLLHTLRKTEEQRDEMEANFRDSHKRALDTARNSWCDEQAALVALKDKDFAAKLKQKENELAKMSHAVTSEIEKYQHLHQSLQTLQRDNEEHIENGIAMSKTIESLTMENTTKSQQCEETSRIVASLSDDKQRLNQKLKLMQESTDASLLQFKSERVSLCDDIVRLQALADERVEQVSHLQRQNNEAMQKIQKLAELHETVNSLRDTLTEETQKTRVFQQTKQAELEDKDKEIECLRYNAVAVEHMKIELENSQAEIINLQKNLSELKIIRTHLANKETHVKNLEAEMAEYTKLTDELEDSKLQIESLKESLSDIALVKSQHEQEMSKVESLREIIVDLTEYKTRFDESQKEVESLKKQNLDLKQIQFEVEEKKSEIESLRESISDLSNIKSELKTKNTEFESLRKSYSEFELTKTQLEKLQKNFDSLQNENSLLTEVKTEFEQSMKDVVSELEIVKKNLSENELEIESLRSANSALKNVKVELENSSHEVETLRESLLEFSDLQIECKKKNSEIESLQKQNMELTTSTENKMKSEIEKDNEIKRLHNCVSELENRSKALNEVSDKLLNLESENSHLISSKEFLSQSLKNSSHEFEEEKNLLEDSIKSLTEEIVKHRETVISLNEDKEKNNVQNAEKLQQKNVEISSLECAQATLTETIEQFSTIKKQLEDTQALVDVEKAKSNQLAQVLADITDDDVREQVEMLQDAHAKARAENHQIKIALDSIIEANEDKQQAIERDCLDLRQEVMSLRDSLGKAEDRQDLNQITQEMLSQLHVELEKALTHAEKVSNERDNLATLLAAATLARDKNTTTHITLSHDVLNSHIDTESSIVSSIDSTPICDSRQTLTPAISLHSSPISSNHSSSPRIAPSSSSSSSSSVPRPRQKPVATFTDQSSPPAISPRVPHVSRRIPRRGPRRNQGVDRGAPRRRLAPPAYTPATRSAPAVTSHTPSAMLAENAAAIASSSASLASSSSSSSPALPTRPPALASRPSAESSPIATKVSPLASPTSNFSPTATSRTHTRIAAPLRRPVSRRSQTTRANRTAAAARRAAPSTRRKPHPLTTHRVSAAPNTPTRYSSSDNAKTCSPTSSDKHVLAPSRTSLSAARRATPPPTALRARTITRRPSSHQGVIAPKIDDKHASSQKDIDVVKKSQGKTTDDVSLESPSNVAAVKHESSSTMSVQSESTAPTAVRRRRDENARNDNERHGHTPMPYERLHSPETKSWLSRKASTEAELTPYERSPVSGEWLPRRTLSPSSVVDHDNDRLYDTIRELRAQLDRTRNDIDPSLATHSTQQGVDVTTTESLRTRLNDLRNLLSDAKLHISRNFNSEELTDLVQRIDTALEVNDESLLRNVNSTSPHIHLSLMNELKHALQCVHELEHRLAIIKKNPVAEKIRSGTTRLSCNKMFLFSIMFLFALTLFASLLSATFDSSHVIFLLQLFTGFNEVYHDDDGTSPHVNEFTNQRIHEL